MDPLEQAKHIWQGNYCKYLRRRFGGDYKIIQFHPSFSYEDFMEGIRPSIRQESDRLIYEVKDMIFKKFCQSAASNPNEKYILVIDEINRGEILENYYIV
jgi:5-methylcytosine-specific restriction endonuclease McrBC GTP-binding regulatory subunit McrB